MPNRRSRANMILTARNGQWTAEDKSRNGIYVGGVRQARVAIDDDVAINLGAPAGPRLTFRITTQVVPEARNSFSANGCTRATSQARPTTEACGPIAIADRSDQPHHSRGHPAAFDQARRRSAQRHALPHQLFLRAGPHGTPRYLAPPAGPPPLPRPGAPTRVTEADVAAAADDDDVLARMTGVVKKVLATTGGAGAAGRRHHDRAAFDVGHSD